MAKVGCKVGSAYNNGYMLAESDIFSADFQVSGFSNSEEEAVQKTKYMPFLLEDKLKELGGLYECGPNWVCLLRHALSYTFHRFFLLFIYSRFIQ